MSRMPSRAAGACLKFVPLAVTGSMVLAACGSEARQAPQGHAAQPVYSVADVRLGMSPAETETALKAKGYDVTEDTTGDSFQSFVNSAQAQATNTLGKPATQKAITGIHGRKGGETIDVALIDLQTGPVVYSMTYHGPGGGKTFADVKEDLVKRFGPSVDQNPGVSTTWCAHDGANKSCRFDQPTLRLFVNPDIKILLDDSGHASNTRLAQVHAVVAKAEPAKSSY